MIKKKNIKLEIKNCMNLDDYEILCDWTLYKLIVFNLLQNSVKYNIKNGYILIDLSLKKINDDYFLITTIEDSGKGIE